jgi:hypothetical protein
MEGVMVGLRLGRLPDRTPVKVTVSLSPELNEALADYSALYEETYGHAGPVQELIPAMLAGFLDGDKQFARRRRERRS